MKKSTVLMALTAVALTTNIQANQDVSGFYIGAGVGSTNTSNDTDGFSIDADTDGSTLKAIGGYQFNRVVAIEAQYTKYGDIIPLPSVNQIYKWSPTTVSLSANLGYTFDNGLRPFTTIGLSSLDLDQSLVSPLDDSSSTALHFGLGLEYTPASLSGISFRTGYEGDAFLIDNSLNYVSDTAVLIGSFYVAALYKF